MTPKEKALELYDKFFKQLCRSSYPYEYAKINATICVNEILNLPSSYDGRMVALSKEDYQYWLEVKKQIQCL